ncbi:FG-GAP-like repeat-containing protein [Kitasatospora sp. NPDC096147]|uniref:FG-GAP-like repeat-containing protein n=1 Tax=Kitasatospora sp. NPDC096147 TaxID=3364093 RepID=UPI0038256C7A
MGRSVPRTPGPAARQPARGRSRTAAALVLAVAVATVLPAGGTAVAAGPDHTAFAAAVNLDDNGRGGSAVAIGDLNGDGKPDLVTAIRAEGLGVLLGTGGGFGPVTKYQAPRTVSSVFLGSVAIRDLNGDGHPDVVSHDARGNVALVWPGDGSGALGAGTKVQLNPVAGCDSTGDNPCVARFPTGVAVADFDGDGTPDLATSNANTDNVSVVLGHGDGTFGPAVQVALGATNPQGIAAADLDGDGDQDLVTANSTSGTLSVLPGDGAGGFGPASGVPAGVALPSRVLLADLNADGRPDAVVVAPGVPGSVAVLPGTGSGGFGPASVLSAGTNPSAGAVADLNGDGHADLVLASADSNEVVVLEGDGTGAFGTPLVFGLAGGRNPQAVAVGDLDADGRPDLATANSNSSPAFVNDASVLFNRTNRPPTAAGDTYGHIGADTPLVVGAPGVLGNDTDPDGDPLTATLVTGPAHGTLTFGADGSFAYQPGSGYVGADGFTYRVSDGTDDSGLATVTITVTAGCHGLAATITGSGTVNGTSGADVIVTGNGNDLVSGNGGNDTICTFGGNDAVAAGSGADHVDAGDGNDAVSGGDGNDVLLGGAGNDAVSGGDGNDLLNGGAGDDALSGGGGSDVVVGGAGSDTLAGGSGTDVCAGDANGGPVLPGTDSLAPGASCESVVEVP